VEVRVVGGFDGSGCSQLLLFLGKCLLAVTMFGVDVGVGEVLKMRGLWLPCEG
jgi:hypothetical protein